MRYYLIYCLTKALVHEALILIIALQNIVFVTYSVPVCNERLLSSFLFLLYSCVPPVWVPSSSIVRPCCAPSRCSPSSTWAARLIKYNLLLGSLLCCLLLPTYSCEFCSCPVHKSTVLLYGKICMSRINIVLRRCAYFSLAIYAKIVLQCPHMFSISSNLFSHFSPICSSFTLENTVDTYVHNISICFMVSPAFWHNMHIPGPSHPRCCKLS